MKRFNRILICILLVITSVISLSSCKDPYIELKEGKTTYEGISLKIESIDYSGDSISLNAVWINNTPYEVVYGLEYSIERYVDGDWINSMKSDIEFIEIACVLDPYAKNEQTYSLSHADISKAGQYHIRTIGYVHKENEVVSCSLTANFKVDNELTLLGYHKLDYELNTWLYEDLRPYYKAGEKVIVKIGKAYDIGFDLYLDGEQLVMESWDGDYWQYSFTMPDHPVKLTYNTYDGMLG